MMVTPSMGFDHPCKNPDTGIISHSCVMESYRNRYVNRPELIFKGRESLRKANINIEKGLNYFSGIPVVGRISKTVKQFTQDISKLIIRDEQGDAFYQTINKAHKEFANSFQNINYKQATSLEIEANYKVLDAYLKEAKSWLKEDLLLPEEKAALTHYIAKLESGKEDIAISLLLKSQKTGTEAQKQLTELGINSEDLKNKVKDTQQLLLDFYNQYDKDNRLTKEEIELAQQKKDIQIYEDYQMFSRGTLKLLSVFEPEFVASVGPVIDAGFTIFIAVEKLSLSDLTSPFGQYGVILNAMGTLFGSPQSNVYQQMMENLQKISQQIADLHIAMLEGFDGVHGHIDAFEIKVMKQFSAVIDLNVETQAKLDQALEKMNRFHQEWYTHEIQQVEKQKTDFMRSYYLNTDGCIDGSRDSQECLATIHQYLKTEIPQMNPLFVGEDLSLIQNKTIQPNLNNHIAYIINNLRSLRMISTDANVTPLHPDLLELVMRDLTFILSKEEVKDLKQDFADLKQTVQRIKNKQKRFYETLAALKSSELSRNYQLAVNDLLNKIKNATSNIEKDFNATAAARIYRSEQIETLNEGTHSDIYNKLSSYKKMGVIPTDVRNSILLKNKKAATTPVSPFLNQEKLAGSYYWIKSCSPEKGEPSFAMEVDEIADYIGKELATLLVSETNIGESENLPPLNICYHAEYSQGFKQEDIHIADITENGVPNSIKSFYGPKFKKLKCNTKPEECHFNPVGHGYHNVHQQGPVFVGMEFDINTMRNFPLYEIKEYINLYYRAPIIKKMSFNFELMINRNESLSLKRTVEIKLPEACTLYQDSTGSYFQSIFAPFNPKTLKTCPSIEFNFLKSLYMWNKENKEVLESNKTTIQKGLEAQGFKRVAYIQNILSRSTKLMTVETERITKLAYIIKAKDFFLDAPNKSLPLSILTGDEFITHYNSFLDFGKDFSIAYESMKSGYGKSDMETDVKFDLPEIELISIFSEF